MMQSLFKRIKNFFANSRQPEITEEIWDEEAIAKEIWVNSSKRHYEAHCLLEDLNFRCTFTNASESNPNWSHYINDYFYEREDFNYYAQWDTFQDKISWRHKAHGERKSFEEIFELLSEEEKDIAIFNFDLFG